MKKIILILLSILSITFASCGDAKLYDAVVVEQINILDGKDYKYEVKLKTDINNDDAYYYTNFRFQVGDTLVSYYQFFEGKNAEIGRLSQENDSLRKELSVSNYYLQILKERVIIDTLKIK